MSSYTLLMPVEVEAGGRSMADVPGLGVVATSASASTSTRGDAFARCACGSLSYSKEYKEAFGVALCSVCKRNEKLISKVRESRSREERVCACVCEGCCVFD